MKLFVVIFMCLFVLLSHVKAAPKQNNAGEIVGIWKGDIQVLNHNTRYKEPSYLHVGKMVMSVDVYGNVIGRLDNECAFEGSTMGFGLKSPARLNIRLRRCPDPEFNKKYSGLLSREGQLLISWEMMDDIYPIVLRLNGVLEKSKPKR